VAQGSGNGQGAGAAPRVAIGRLPATGRELFGREAELLWLDACWRDGVQLASVVAFGGVGKTALVNRWLAGMRDKGWDGARRVFGWSFSSQGTARLGSSDELLAAALRWFGEEGMIGASAWDKGVRLGELVGEERSLLVLDGVEPLQWGPGVQEGQFEDQGLQALLETLAGLSAGMCLVTSRMALADLDRWSGDKVRSKDLGHLSPEAGAALLRSRKVKGTEEELREAAEEYEGHGLALALLGSYLEEVAEGDIQRRHEIGPLMVDERLGGHARRVMATYEGWLGKPEVTILHLIGLFDRPAGEGEMGALRAEPPVPGLNDALVGSVGRAWNQAVARLRRVGLLLGEQDERLDAHPLVREYFGEQLRSEQPEAWREGHRRLYEHLEATTRELPETLEEMGPLFAAVVHGCLAGKRQEARRDILMNRIQRRNEYFATKKLGAFGSEVAALSAFFEPPWERLAPGLSAYEEALVVGQAGTRLRALGRLPEATRLMRLSLTMAIAQQDWTNAGARASNLSELLHSQGDLRDALAQAEAGVDLADKGSNAFWRMVSRTKVAAALHALGRREKAAALFDEAERTQQEQDPLHPRLHSLQGFQYCDLLLDEGRDGEVGERAAQAMTIATQNNWLLDSALDHLSLGRAQRLAAQRQPAPDLEPAATHLTQAVDGLRLAGQQDYLPLGLLARAALHTHTGAFPLAHGDLAESLSLSTRCGFRLHRADTHLALARLHLAEGHPDLAAPHLGSARALIAETGYHRRDAQLAELESRRRERAEDEVGTARAPAASPAPLAAASGPPSPPPALLPSIAMANLPDLPPPLLAAHAAGILGVLVGSGFSRAGGVVGGFPKWTDLPGRFLDQIAALGQRDKAWVDKRRMLLEPNLSLVDMLAMLDGFQAALDRSYQQALTSVFRPDPITPGDVHKALVELDVALLATTNYDELIEEAGGPRRAVYTWRESDKALADIAQKRRVLFKIHGTASRADTMVMTRREYDAAGHDAAYQRIQGDLFQNHTFLFVGYGMNDPYDLDLTLDLNARSFGVAVRRHYLLMHKDEAAPHAERWDREKNLQVITFEDYADLPAILRALGGARTSPR
jgi:tetratricopeptide (TPR) repeat protein